MTPFLARPVNRSGPMEAECCSFSGRIPGVMDCVSSLFSKERLPGLQTIEVRDEDAIRTTRRLIARGFPVGPSSGLNFEAAIEAAWSMGPGARIATVFPDRMERYFTTDLFSPFTAMG